jgi:hypothetical protein
LSEEILKTIKNKKTTFYNWKTKRRKKDIHDHFLLEKKIIAYELRKNCRKEMAQKRIQERQTITEARTFLLLVWSLEHARLFLYMIG